MLKANIVDWRKKEFQDLQNNLNTDPKGIVLLFLRCSNEPHNMEQL